MKKILAVFLTCLLTFGGFAFAETDLQTMTFEELIAFQKQLSKEISSRPEWKEVIVPPGLYEIGIDIPAGYWTLTPKDDSAAFLYGDSLNETRTDITFDGEIYEMKSILKTGSKTYNSYVDVYGKETIDGMYTDQWSANMIEGCFLIVQSGSVIFSPFVRPILDF